MDNSSGFSMDGAPYMRRSSSDVGAHDLEMVNADELELELGAIRPKARRDDEYSHPGVGAASRKQLPRVARD